MAGSKAIWFFVVLSISMLLSWTNPRGETLKSFYPSPLDYSNSSTQSASSSNDDLSSSKYDFYHEICPKAESIIRTSVARIYSDHSNVSAALLRLFFHDCFIEGCDASVLLGDSNGDKNHSIERRAIPNQTFDKIDSIKEELENACPGVVSCADIVSIATRDGIMLADDNITHTLHLFDLKGIDERETVSLLGAHNIGKIGCEFIQKRLSNFKGTWQPDPTIAPDFLTEMRMRCQDSNGTTTRPSSSSMASLEMITHYTSSPLSLSHLEETEKWQAAGRMTYLQALSSSISSGAGFETHYYQSLLNGRGLLFANQQLMANEKTARLVRAYASDDGSTSQMDFAGAMMKMSGLNILTGSQGQV
ncbi:hypothetical protein ACB094_11G027300 [Castanea mollissima]